MDAWQKLVNTWIHLPTWNKFDPLFKVADARRGIHWQTLKAVCMNESTLGTIRSVAHGLEWPADIGGSKSDDGLSWGVMQITITTALDLDPLATERQLNYPDYSIDMAARYLAILRGKFSQYDARCLEWTIKAYNQGPGKTKKEIAGLSAGKANEYWERFQKHLKIVLENSGPV